MTLESKRLLLGNCKKQYTLTVNVTTDNSSPLVASITLNGEETNASTASITVDENTVVNYKVSKSPYTPDATGAVIMDSDKTITVNGTYSTTTTYHSFSRPNLTSNGTLGGSSFAVYASDYYSKCYPYCAVDGVNITSYKNGNQWITQGGESFIFYNPNALRVTSLTINGGYGGTYSYRAYTGTVYGSNNNSNYSSVGSWSVAKTTAATKVITVSLSSNTNYYKYYKLTPTAFINSTNWGISELYITATYGTTSYTYYWDIAIS